ncbi:hypothetical protein [Actinomadura fibrosa]|uniref:Uncharacterized protein n=1 Tax=Actinomadura fibrosa TaxID=111802 RepID=A0ABW2XLZ9_9ACTN|nr:hypothetical protein [Actinomadura fibrosa]
MSTDEETTPLRLSAGGRRLLARLPRPLLVAGGFLLVTQVFLGIGLAAPDGGGSSGTDGGGGGAAAASRASGPVEITFVLNGDRRTARVSPPVPGGAKVDEIEEAALPLRRTVRADAGETVSAQIQNNWRNGPGRVTCTALVGGKVVGQESAFGAYAIATCQGSGDAKPIPGATVPAQGNDLLTGETRLATTVRVKRYRGAGSPVAGRVDDGDPRLSYVALGGEWGRSRAVDPGIAGFNREQKFDTEVKWQAVIASGFVDDDLMDAGEGKGKGRLRALAGAVQDYRQFIGFDETARGRDVASQPVTVSGRKGWLVVREIRFSKKGVRAKMDLSAVVIVDTGRPRPSLLWIDIPETHKRLWPDINTVISSLRVTG